MAEQRPFIEKVLGLVVYAPVGLVVQLGTDVPALVASGRTRVHERVQVARWVGEMAVTYGRQEIERRLAPEAAPKAAPKAAPTTKVAVTAAATAPPTVAHSHVPRHQPFEGYDHLAAAQIVQLLGRLPHGELELIRDYEAAGRRRRTILAKIDQLSGR